MNWLLSEVVIINEFFPSSVSISLIGREDSFIVSKSRRKMRGLAAFFNLNSDGKNHIFLVKLYTEHFTHLILYKVISRK